MRDKGATTFVATHYPELKIYAHATTGVANANVEFDLNTLAPTYHLSIGLPGRSNAFAIAARLGMPVHIIESARGMVDQSDLHTEDLLAGIAKAHQQTLLAQHEAEVARREVEDMLADVRAQWTYIDDERREVVNAAREQARRELHALQTKIEEARAKLKAAPALEAVETVAEDVAALQELAEPEPTQAPPPPAEFKRRADHPIEVGDTVWVEALGTSGQVTDLLDEGDEAEVQVGRMRVRAKVRDLLWQEPPPEPEPRQETMRGISLAQPIQSPGIEIDLRGQTTDEALPRLDKHLDAAALAGLPWVRVIHGHGTGTLRRAVRNMLDKHPLVKGYKAAPANEGGEGVTIARFVAE
jgi:DNA mismatch repair protein MutS2